MPPCRVIIVEDHAITQSGMRFLLESVGDLTVCAMVGTGEEAIRQTQALEPDLLILDMMLPGGSGLYVLEQVKQLSHPPRVIVFSGQASGLDFKRLLDQGADALLSKSDSPEEILAAVEAVRAGESYRSSRVEKLIGPLDAEVPRSEIVLTRREKQILTMVAEGRSSQEIADQLHIALHTVKKHRANLMQKLGVSSVVEATRLAVEMGLASIAR